MSGDEAGSRGWRALHRQHPRVVTVVAAIIACLVAADLVLVARWLRYRRETDRLLRSLTDVERERADLLAASATRREQMLSELLRRQASTDRTLHLAVSIDSGVMRLERDGARLREMRVAMGPEDPATAADSAWSGGAAPRLLGTRTVERVLTAKDAWELPAAVFANRALPVPENRAIPGVLGRDALVLAGGTVIYALPDSGLLADSGYVLPGAVRVTRHDLRAIAPAITPGTTVYFFR